MSFCCPDAFFFCQIKQDKVDCFFKGKESSKAEECAAICQLHGVDVGAPLSLQLKAIDKEYQQLKENGQSAKADHVQGLFAWKSKQATQVTVDMFLCIMMMMVMMMVMHILEYQNYCTTPTSTTTNLSLSFIYLLLSCITKLLLKTQLVIKRSILFWIYIIIIIRYEYKGYIGYPFILCLSLILSIINSHLLSRSMTPTHVNTQTHTHIRIYLNLNNLLFVATYDVKWGMLYVLLFLYVSPSWCVVHLSFTKTGWPGSHYMPRFSAILSVYRFMYVKICAGMGLYMYRFVVM